MLWDASLSFCRGSGARSRVLREERKAFFQYRPGLDYRRDGYKVKSRVKQSTGENLATLGAGLVSVSGVLVLGVLTLDYRINVNSSNRKRVNSRKSGAWFQSSVHHDSEKG